MTALLSLFDSGFLTTRSGKVVHFVLCASLIFCLLLYAFTVLLLDPNDPLVVGLFCMVSTVWVTGLGLHCLLFLRLEFECRRSLDNALAPRSWIMYYYSFFMILQAIIDIVYNFFSVFKSNILPLVFLQIATIMLEFTLLLSTTRLDTIWYFGPKNGAITIGQLKVFYVSFGLCAFTLIVLNIATELFGVLDNEEVNPYVRMLIICAVIVHLKVLPFVLKLFFMKIRNPNLIVADFISPSVDAFIEHRLAENRNRNNSSNPDGGDNTANSQVKMIKKRDKRTSKNAARHASISGIGGDFEMLLGPEEETSAA
eukprot:ANDGO_07927.mRNA.1 hypothetical protein